MRKPTRRRLDRKVFSYTASSSKTKRINLLPRVMRGGIRL